MAPHNKLIALNSCLHTASTLFDASPTLCCGSPPRCWRCSSSLPQIWDVCGRNQTTVADDVLRANIKFYNGTGRGALGAQAENWTYATIRLSSGQVTAGAPDEDLVPPPEPAADSMAGHRLIISEGGNATLLDPLNMSVVFLDFSANLPPAQQDETNRNLLILPVLSFVSEKLNLAYIFVPDFEPASDGVSDNVLTMMVTIDLSTANVKLTESDRATSLGTSPCSKDVISHCMHQQFAAGESRHCLLLHDRSSQCFRSVPPQNSCICT